jgi:hypothetical protein
MSVLVVDWFVPKRAIAEEEDLHAIFIFTGFEATAVVSNTAVAHNSAKASERSVVASNCCFMGVALRHFFEIGQEGLRRRSRSMKRKTATTALTSAAMPRCTVNHGSGCERSNRRVNAMIPW